MLAPVAALLEVPVRPSPAAAVVTTALATALLAGCGGSSKPSPAPAPTITQVFPGSGSTAGGTPVVITGTHFPSPAVTFGGAAPAVVSATATALGVTARPTRPAP